MRATAIRKKGAASFEELKPACQILILHEDFPAYARAVDVCRRVMERFAAAMDFDIKCWNFIELADPNCARHAAKTAGGADIVLLSMHATKLPSELDRWLDFYFVSRFKAEGMLVLVLNGVAAAHPSPEELVARLERSAARLEMQFIALPPDDECSVLNLQPMAEAIQAHPVQANMR